LGLAERDRERDKRKVADAFVGDEVDERVDAFRT